MPSDFNYDDPNKSPKNTEFELLKFCLEIMETQGCSKMSIGSCIQRAWTLGTLDVDELAEIANLYGFNLTAFYSTNDKETL